MNSYISDDMRKELSSMIQTSLNEAESRWQLKQDARDAAELKAMFASLSAQIGSLSAQIVKGPTGTSSMAPPNPDLSNGAWNNYLASSDPREQIGPYEPWNKNPKRFGGAASNYDDLQSTGYVPAPQSYRPDKSTEYSFPPLMPPPCSRDRFVRFKRAETYAKTAVDHFNSVEDTQFEFIGLTSIDSGDADMLKVYFLAYQPENDATAACFLAAHFHAKVAEDEVRGCAVIAPSELIAEFHAKHAISKYNNEKGAAYEVVEILHYHDDLIIGYTRRGQWFHFNFTAVSKSSSDKLPVLFFCEANTNNSIEEEFGCCIVDRQHPEATYECEICPRQKNICHPSKSPVGGLVRGPEFAARHFDGGDICHSMY